MGCRTRVYRMVIGLAILGIQPIASGPNALGQSPALLEGGMLEAPILDTAVVDSPPFDTAYAETMPCDVEPATPGFSAGYDNGFFIKTDDDSFKLKLRGLLQARHYSNWREIDPAFGDSTESGFVVERASLIFAGNAIVPQLDYWFVLNGDRSTGTRFVEEARIGYELSNGMLVQLGRLRNPAFLRELDVSYARQLGIERSYYNSVFTTGVLEGITLTSQGDSLRMIGFLSDGRHSGSAAKAKDFYLDNADIAFTFGADWKLFGEWAQFGDLASWSGEEAAFFLGAGIHYEQGETGDDDLTNDYNSFLAWTFDLTYENDGFMIFASTVGRHSQNEVIDVNQSGALLMTSYQIIPEKAEPFLRCEYIDFDGFRDVGNIAAVVDDSTVSLVTAGFNWYFDRHACKLTVEVTHAFDPLPFTAGNAGIIADQPGSDGQTILGSQVQLFF